MIELLFIFAPGALTYLTAQKLSGKTEEHGYSMLAEVFVYSSLNLCISWFLKRWKDPALTEFVLNEAGKVHYSGMDFIKCLLVAFALGILFAFIKTIRFQVSIHPNTNGLFSKLSPRAKKGLSWAVRVLVLLGIVLFISYPRIQVEIAKSRENTARKNAFDLIELVKKEIGDSIADGKQPEEFADLSINGVIVKRVDKDQSWKNGSGKEGVNAAYIMDANGEMVYFTYQDMYHAGTWSGPSEDPAFLELHKGWNKGKGYGWNGILKQGGSGTKK